MIKELVKAIAEKDFVTTKDIFESLVQEKLATKIEEERIDVAKKMFGMEISEELKGNQHKLDANKNGKIDADDFKKLRSKKKVDEDDDCGIEESKLDEVSSSLVSRYIQSARPQSEFSPTGVAAPGKDRTSGVRLALKKKWGDKKFGFPEPKVKATDN